MRRGGRLVDRRLSGAERLRSRRQYLEVQRRGLRIFQEDLIAVALARDSKDGCSAEQVPCRLGITASKRIGTAVRRNRIKRRFKAAWCQHKFLMPSGFDIVLIARKDASDATYWEIERQIKAIGIRLCQKYYCQR